MKIRALHRATPLTVLYHDTTAKSKDGIPCHIPLNIIEKCINIIVIIDILNYDISMKRYKIYL